MAKKLTFLLVIMFVLLTASVTAFAGNTESATPETGFTQEKTDPAAAEINVSDLEDNYGDIFFDDKSQSDKEIIEINYDREIDSESELRYNFGGTVVNPTTSSAIMLLYIKIDGEYVPLNSVETGTNISEGFTITCLKADLAYLGSDKVNEVRIIAFNSRDINSLELNENVQITDFKITVKPRNWFQKAKITLGDLIEKMTPETK